MNKRSDEVFVWPLCTRMIHWIIATSFLLAFVTSFDRTLFEWHLAFGFIFGIMLALKSRLIKKMSERAQKEFITSVFGYFFTKALYDSEEKSLALKARGFFDKS